MFDRKAIPPPRDGQPAQVVLSEEFAARHALCAKTPYTVLGRHPLPDYSAWLIEDRPDGKVIAVGQRECAPVIA